MTGVCTWSYVEGLTIENFFETSSQTRRKMQYANTKFMQSSLEHDQ